jgi:hypothetical protein
MNEPKGHGLTPAATMAVQKHGAATRKVGGTVLGSKTKAKAGAAGVRTKSGKAKRTATAEKASPRADRDARSTSWQPEVRANLVVRVLGNRRTAALLGVAESQPSRWRNAVEVPSAQVAPLLVDLDHVVARLQLIWDEEIIGDWLEGPNAFLEGSRPIDVLRINGSGPVLEAIEAEAAGAYA